MSIRGVPVGKVKKELAKAKRYSLDIDYIVLESHFHAGGDIEDLTNSLIFSKENGMNLSIQKACAGQLMSQYQDKFPFAKKLEIMLAEGISEVDEFLAGKSNQTMQDYSGSCRMASDE